MAPAGVRVPKDHEFVETEYGSYIIPRYDLMTPEELQMRRQTLTLQFQMLNDNWRHYGLAFAMPTEDETVRNIALRYKMSVRYIMARSGAEIYKLLLVFAWITIEIICVKIGLKASGYTAMQLRMYDTYQTILVEMGEAQGFGEGWSPWVRIMIISGVTAVIFVLMNALIGNGAGQSEILARLLAQFISGNVSNVTTDNEHEVPQPDPTMGGLGNALGGINLGNIDIATVLATLTTAMSGQMQRGQTAGVSASTAQGTTTPRATTGARERCRRPTFTG